MANKVTNYREVRYSIDTKIDALHWDEFMHEVSCTWFDKDGDYYAVYENLDERDDENRKKYAIYLHSTGELICLMADSGLVLDCCYDDEEYMNTRNELYKQIAMLAGWPENISTKNRYTLRINRVMDVEVRADSLEEACTIGRKLAYRANHVGNKYGTMVQNVMSGCEYEFAEVLDTAAYEDDIDWDLVLDERMCTKLLEERDYS